MSTEERVFWIEWYLAEGVRLKQKGKPTVAVSPWAIPELLGRKEERDQPED